MEKSMENEMEISRPFNVLTELHRVSIGFRDNGESDGKDKWE